jgi:hypothetical protein
MGIESLHKAALAAGFAMATPDDDPPLDVQGPADALRPHRWRSFVGIADRGAATRDSVTAAVGWLRDRLPVMGGRAPA